MSRVGTRAQVMHGNALRTGGGLTKKDLKYNKQGKIVSKTMSMRAKKEKRLEKAGWTVRKGQFGAFKMSGGGKFILGPYSRYKEDSNISKPVTPMPIYVLYIISDYIHNSNKIIDEINKFYTNKNKKTNETNENDENNRQGFLGNNNGYNGNNNENNNVKLYPKNNPFHEEHLVKVNHNVIIAALKVVYDKYMLGNMPEDEELKKMPSRQIIMYLGLKPSEFKNRLLNEWKKLKGVLKEVEKYINIATRNKNNRIRGIKISGKNKGVKIPPSIVKEQTLWKLALNLGSSIEYEIQLLFGGKIIKRFRMNLENYRVKNKDREYIMSTITRHYLAENSNIRKNYIIQKLLNINTDDYIIQLKLTTRPRPKAKTAKNQKQKQKQQKK